MPPYNPRRTNLTPPERSQPRPIPTLATTRPAQQQYGQDAAAGIVRNQIETIYQQGAQNQSPQAASFAATSHSNPDSPYDRTHRAGRTKIPAEQWKRYHSAWQDYYRQYYERYYLGEVYRMQQDLESQSQQASPVATQTQPVNQAAAQAHLAQHEPAPVDSEEVYHDLRADLLNNVRESATKVRGSRFFAPILAGCLVLLSLFLLHYNPVIMARAHAYVSPGSINPANIVVDPNIDIPVSEEPRLIIPKINVDVPVVYDTGFDHASQMRAMERGVAWFGIPGANSKPGQVGNTVLSGHSSNDLFDPGDYKFIFARLEQLAIGDTFYANYLGKRYMYSITKKEVVKPTDVHKLIYDTEGKPVMTLITCVPLGTAQNRLLVTAEQISPDPTQANAAPDAPAATDTEDTAMPGMTPGILSRLFGAS